MQKWRFNASLTIDAGLDDLLFFALHVCCPWWYISASVSEIKQVYLRALQTMCCGEPAQWAQLPFLSKSFWFRCPKYIYKNYICLHCTFWNRRSPYISRFYTTINRFLSHVSITFHLGMKPVKDTRLVDNNEYICPIYIRRYSWNTLYRSVCPKKSCY